MNKELYSYIIGSLDVMNKSLILNEQNTVKLFSYLYNNYYDLANKVSQIEANVLNVQNSIVKLNDGFTKKNNIILKEISTLKKKHKQCEDKLSIIEGKKTKLQILIENIKTTILTFFINSYNNIKNIFNRYYKKLYNLIFYKKVKKQKEELKRKEEEENKRKENEYSEMIKNILKK